MQFQIHIGPFLERWYSGMELDLTHESWKHLEMPPTKTKKKTSSISWNN